MNLPTKPLTNNEIQNLSPSEIAQTTIYYLSRADKSNEYCPWRGRNFDDLWENGRSDEIAVEFAKIISTNEKAKELARDFGGQPWVDHFLSMLQPA